MSDQHDSNQAGEGLSLYSAGAQIRPDAWTVVAHTRRVQKDWQKLIRRAPDICEKCYVYLSENPTRHVPGNIFPLKGKKYAGAWEYKFSTGDRVFYVPIEAERKVVVYYAGEHPKGAVPFPPPGLPKPSTDVK